MAKGNGGTRSQGPAQAAGGRENTPVDEYAEWRKREGSELYSYDRDKVKFDVFKPVQDLDGSYIDGITPKLLRYKAEYDIYSVPRNMKDGKFHLVEDKEYWYSEKMTFNQAINKVVDDAKKSYKYNEKIRDSVMEIEAEDDNAPTAWIWVGLQGDNKVRISIDRFKP